MNMMTAMRRFLGRLSRTPSRPRVHLYAIAWNEERMLPFFFRHYDRFVDRYVIYDDDSSDSTPELLRAHPRVEARRFERTVPDSLVLSAQAVHDSCWKESRGAADWVIIADIDEHLHHPDLAAYLESCKRGRVSAMPALGYQMIADIFPQGDRLLCEQVRMGEPAAAMSKMLIFDPDRLAETNFAVGRHSARPGGEVRYPKRDRLLNLHFKGLGLDEVVARYRLLAARCGARDRANRWGHHYDQPAEKVAETFHARRGRAFDVIAAGDQAATGHPGPRWWRT